MIPFMSNAPQANRKLPNLLCHYCSLQSLRGIIQEKHLHMTNVFWMDDTTEIFWLYEVVKRILDGMPSEVSSPLNERFREIIDARRISHVFCASFSEDSDSRSQWLEYADDGHGFAIGFDPNALNLNRLPPNRNVELEPVIYNEKKQEQIAEKVVESLRTIGHGEASTDFQLFAANHNTWWRAVYCKNPAFKNEKEWRLIFRDNPGDGLEFRERAGRQLIPFAKFPLEPAKNPIREIRLGPRNQSQRNVDAIAQLLRIHDYDPTNVVFPKSNVPLRPEY